MITLLVNEKRKSTDTTVEFEELDRFLASSNGCYSASSFRLLFTQKELKIEFQ